MTIAVIWGQLTTLEQREAYQRNLTPSTWVPNKGDRVKLKSTGELGIVFTQGTITCWVTFAVGQRPYETQEVLTQDLESAPEDWEIP